MILLADERIVEGVMTEDQFTKLFKYMQGEFATVREEIQGVRQDVNEVRTIVDGIAGTLKNFEQEQTIINHQVDGKLDQLSDATGIKWVTE